MPSLRFAPYREIASEIASRLLSGRDGREPLAPWDEEVIVPSRGAAEAITAELLARMPGGIAGLQLQSLEALATRVLSANGQTPRIASDAERRLAMRMAVRTIDDGMMSSRGIASMLERSYRDVRDSGSTLAQFVRRVESTRGLRNARRTELVIRAWTEYERRIAQLHAIDPADLFQRAARLIDARVKPQLLAGFYDMTGAQWRVAEGLLRAGRVAGIWVPSEAPFARAFVELVTPYAVPAVREPLPSRAPLPSQGERVAEGRVRGALGRQNTRETPHPPSAPSPLCGGEKDSRTPVSRDCVIRVTPYDTRHDELRDVCMRVSALLADGTPPAEIGIVARSLEPYDMRLLNRFAAEQGFATTLSEEIPLGAHRIGRGALTLLRLRDRGFPRSEVLELVRDGLRTKTKLDADAADSETRRARIAGGTREELQRMRNRTPVIDAYIALVAELEELTSSIDLSLLTRLGSLFRVETDADLEAAEQLDEITALFRRFGSSTPPDITDAIEQATRSCAPRPAPRPLVWAGEVARFRGRAFTHLFAVRMQDDVFPQRRTEDPLLPDSDRRLLGLREIGDGRDEEQLLFSLLGDSTSERLHFSYATGDGFGKVLRPSRYVRGIAQAERRDPPAASNQQPRQRQLQLLVKAGTRSPFDGYIPGIDPSTLRLSPTHLEDFGECPQKFLFKHILGARDIDHPERELQIHHRDKGILDHTILERFYRSMSDEEFGDAHAALPRLDDALAARLDGLVDTVFQEHEGDVPPFNRTVREIERRATKRILREFVVHDLADLEANSLRPRHFEYRFGRSKGDAPADHPEPFVVEVTGVPVRVEGTIDRIDTGIGTYRIVDYKSGKALRHANLGEKIDRGVRLQLALYAMAVAEFFQAEPANVSGTIKPLVIGEIKAPKFAFALAEKREALLETLAIFINAIRTGAFPAFPNESDEFNSCKYCPVNHSCRTRHDLEDRYAVLQQKDPRTLLGGGTP